MLKAEMETTITYCADDDKVRIHTCIRRDIGALRRKGVEEIDSGTYKDGTEWVVFEVDADRFNPAGAIRIVREQSPEQKAAAAARMAKARAAKMK